jgi:hypothetical protein
MLLAVGTLEKQTFIWQSISSETNPLKIACPAAVEVAALINAPLAASLSKKKTH